jgi:sulfite exporter TauE/SafE
VRALEFLLTNTELSPVIIAFIAGVFVGLVTCPSCAFPLASYILGAKGNAREGFLTGVLFNAGRLTAYSILGGIFGLMGALAFESQLIKTASQGLVNVFMCILGFQLLNLMELPKVSFKVPFPCKGNVGVFFWGLLLGNVCAAEFFSILVIVLLNSALAENMLLGVASMLVFGIGTMLPSLAVSSLAGGISAWYKHKERLATIGGSALLFLVILNASGGYPGHEMLVLPVLGAIIVGAMMSQRGFKSPTIFGGMVMGSIVALAIKEIQVLSAGLEVRIAYLEVMLIWIGVLFFILMRKSNAFKETSA